MSMVSVSCCFQKNLALQHNVLRYLAPNSSLDNSICFKFDMAFIWLFYTSFFCPVLILANDERSQISEIIISQPFVRNQLQFVTTDRVTGSLAISLIKYISKTSSLTLAIANHKTLTKHQIQQMSSIFIANRAEDLQSVLTFVRLKNLGRRHKIIIIAMDLSMTDLKQLQVDIALDQNVFVVILQASELLEIYNVNGVSVMNKVGTFAPGGFEWNPSWSPDWRNNLYGTHFTTVTLPSPPNIMLDPAYKSEAPYFESNQTYLVDKFVSGYYLEILKEMSQDLNFTFSIYARRDSIWGTVVDGKPVGMLASLVDNSADLVLSEYSINLVRIPYAKYLPALTPAYLSVAIKKDLKEQFGIDTYTGPYSLGLWMAIFATAVGLALLLFALNVDPKMEVKSG